MLSQLINEFHGAFKIWNMNVSRLKKKGGNINKLTFDDMRTRRRRLEEMAEKVLGLVNDGSDMERRFEIHLIQIGDDMDSLYNFQKSTNINSQSNIVETSAQEENTDNEDQILNDIEGKLFELKKNKTEKLRFYRINQGKKVKYRCGEPQCQIVHNKDGSIRRNKTEFK